MNKHEAENLFSDYLAGELDPDKYRAVEEFLADPDSPAEELGELKMLWESLDHVPVDKPRAALKQRFPLLLKAWEQGAIEARTPASGVWNLIRVTFRGRLQPQSVMVGMGIALLAAGFFVGQALRPAPGTDPALVQLQSEMSGLKQMLVIAYLNDSSASGRIQGLQQAASWKNLPRELAVASLAMLNSDPSVNVRLAALETLLSQPDDSVSRAGLIEAFSRQTSPLIQVELLNYLMKEAAPQEVLALRQAIDTARLPLSVKDCMERALNPLL